MVVALVLLCLPSIAQFKFYTKTDTRKLIQGSTITVEFICENGNITNFKAPDFDGFEVISGPSYSSSQQIINGRSSKSISYTFILQADKVGTFTIAPATGRVGQRTRKTQAIMVEVIKGTKKTVAANKQAYVKLVVNDSTAFVGQQIILDYKLYSTVDVQNYNIDTQDEFDGFYVEEIRRNRRQAEREIIDGVEYFTQVLRRYALFPQQTGTYNITASNVTLGIATGKVTGGFFSRQVTRPLKTRTNDLRIIVANPPGKPPKDFSGAVGKYNVNSRPDKTAFTTDESLSLKMTIVGNGDNRMVLAPEWTHSDGLEFYDPNLISEESYQQGGEIMHKKIYEYLITAEKPGKYILSPSMSYFDVTQDSFVTAGSRQYSIRVNQGQARYDYAEEKDTSDYIFNMIESKTSFSKKEGGFYGSVLHNGLLGILFLALGGVVFYKRRLDKSGNLDPAFIRKQNASPVALEKLQNAHSYISSKDHKAFYENATLALKHYLNDKFDIPAVHSKKEELLQNLQDIQIDSGIVEDTKAILNKSEQALYAPITVTDMESSHQLIISIINRLENAFTETVE